MLQNSVIQREAAPAVLDESIIGNFLILCPFNWDGFSTNTSWDLALGQRSIMMLIAICKRENASARILIQ